MVVVYLVNCISANLLFDGSSKQVSCNSEHYFFAPAQDGQIAANDRGVVQTVNFQNIEFVSFLTTYYIVI